MDNPEVTFIPDRNHHDSEQQQRSGTPIYLMDMDVVDEVACTPSFHPSNVSTPSFSAEQRMQNKFDAVSRQIDDMLITFQMQISAMTKQALDRLDQRYAALDIKPQNLNSVDHHSPIVDKTVSTNNHNSKTVATPQSNANLVTNEQHNIDNTISSNTNLLKTNCNDGSNYLSSLRSTGPSMMTNVDAALTTQLSSSQFPNQYSNSVKLKPQHYDGTEDLDDYLSQFELLADLNCWNYESKSLYLAGSLKGDARTLLTGLCSLQRRDYDSLVQILTLRFGSLNRAEIYKANLQTRSSVETSRSLSLLNLLKS